MGLGERDFSKPDICTWHLQMRLGQEKGWIETAGEPAIPKVPFLAAAQPVTSSAVPPLAFRS